VIEDSASLRAARLARLRMAMREAEMDALVLTHAGSVRYATGAVAVHGDSSVEAARPFAAVVTSRSAHVLGVERERVPSDVEAAPMPRGPRPLAQALADLLRSARTVGLERLAFATGVALEAALPGARFVPAEGATLGARAIKTAEEIALLREAQRLNEAAVAEVLPAIVPAAREVELTGRFLAAMARRGVTTCHVEPLWCVFPRRRADAPWSFAGGVPYRELPSDRTLASGDQIMIDTGMLHAGYMSDVGCTWSCGGEPGVADRALRARWQEILDAVLAACRPGATAADLHRAARRATGAEGPAPWPVPLYLAHGIGIGGVEPPFIGTDLGLAAEEGMLLAPGMVLVLEPCAWEEGRGGYRAEQALVVTSSGYELLSAPPP
jgi:Xaa-Pro aminopeptidase